MTIKDSGHRQSFPTGAVRDIQEGKGRYDLLPMHAIERLAKVYEGGAKKYDDDNWRKGIPLRRYLDSAMRHLCKFAQGQRDEDHAAMALWNIACLIETEFMVQQGLLPNDLCNLPMWISDTTYAPGTPCTETNLGVSPADVPESGVKCDCGTLPVEVSFGPVSPASIDASSSNQDIMDAIELFMGEDADGYDKYDFPDGSKIWRLDDINSWYVQVPSPRDPYPLGFRDSIPDAYRWLLSLGYGKLTTMPAKEADSLHFA